MKRCNKVKDGIVCDGTLYQTNNIEIRKIYPLTCGKCGELYTEEKLKGCCD